MLRIFNEIIYSASGGITQILAFIADGHVCVSPHNISHFLKVKYYLSAMLV